MSWSDVEGAEELKDLRTIFGQKQQFLVIDLENSVSRGTDLSTFVESVAVDGKVFKGSEGGESRQVKIDLGRVNRKGTG